MNVADELLRHSPAGRYRTMTTFLVEMPRTRVFVKVEAESVPHAAAKAWEGDGQIYFGESEVRFEDVKLMPEDMTIDTGCLGADFDQLPAFTEPEGGWESWES
jgi:hypothetical protein